MRKTHIKIFLMQIFFILLVFLVFVLLRYLASNVFFWNRGDIHNADEESELRILDFLGGNRRKKKLQMEKIKNLFIILFCVITNSLNMIHFECKNNSLDTFLFSSETLMDLNEKLIWLHWNKREALHLIFILKKFNIYCRGLIPEKGSRNLLMVSSIFCFSRLVFLMSRFDLWRSLSLPLSSEESAFNPLIKWSSNPISAMAGLNLQVFSADAVGF